MAPLLRALNFYKFPQEPSTKRPALKIEIFYSPEGLAITLVVSYNLGMHITRWGEYGILCSLYLARNYSPESSVGAAEIAESQGIPLQYTQQILQRLRKGEVIESVRGPHGGYKLTASPEAITLRKILYAAEGETFEIVCDVNPVYPGKCDSEHTCGLKMVWHDLKRAIDQLLESETLASLLAKQKLIDSANPVQQLVPAPHAASAK